LKDVKLNQDCWVIVPAYNEAPNLLEVMPRVVEQLRILGSNNRILVIDDGSTDDSISILNVLSNKHPEISYVKLNRNMGKAEALSRGFREAEQGGADIIVMMDADGQDDPGALPRLVGVLDEGYDLVTGARLLRNDRFIKRHTSRIYNKVTSLIAGIPAKDLNSGFKVMRTNVASDLRSILYGELHRYMTVIAYWQGYKITEVSVEHHPRLHGSSKYGISRFWRGLIDLITIRFIMSYESRPSHLFSGIGATLTLIGITISGYMTILWALGESIGSRPLLLAGVFSVLTGIQLVLFGLLSELMVFTRNRKKSN